ncbi:MAG TPA: hypothetical protein VGO90_07855, partial [Chthoniobacteraceae bacterium]|nr:hypothetical protein [Chthoniobacteraceae bacterium]
PSPGIYRGLAGFTRFAPTFGTPDKLPNLFSSGRAIGDEYRYIIERRYSAKYPGNMLTRPGLLLNPWETRKTDTEELLQQAGQAAGGTSGARAGRAPAPAAAMDVELPPHLPAQPDGPNLDFLADAAPVLWNLAPDENGLVVIPRALLGDRQHVQVYAEDLQNAVWLTATLPEVPTKFTDLRLARNLDPAKAFTQRKQVTVLTSGASLKIEDLLTSELESYDTLAGVHALFSTLSGNAHFAEFAWVLRWLAMKDEEKRAKYSEYASHELNFFLSRKDAAFFQTVVQPSLRNKRDKTFMDDYLLGNDLRRYLEPWRFARLNVVERALLASRIPGEPANMARHIRELWELIPPNAEEEDRLFETALRGRALEFDTSESVPGLAETPVALSSSFARAKGEAQQAAEGVAGVAELHAPDAPATPTTRAEGRMAGVELSIEDRSRVGEKLSKMDAAKKPADGKDLAYRFSKQLGRADLSQADAEDLVKEKALNESMSRGVNLNTATEGTSFDADYFGFVEANAQRGRARQQAFYRRLGPTREWAENNYFRLPIAERTADLVTANAFWRDFAAWIADGSKAPFLSKHVAEASRNFTEMMLALAVLDLPFEAAQHSTKTEGNSMTLLAAGPAIIFHKEIQLADAAEPANAGGLLISESFFREGDRYRQEGNERFDKFVTGEFLAGVVYGAHVVVTNPTSAPAKLDLLTQIPQGALPVRGSKTTDSRYLRLEPYTTQQVEYFFYFPAPGTQPFVHFPVHAAVAGKTVASGKASLFTVVRQLSEIDKTSWDYISQYGTDADVFAFLAQHNLERLDLERVAWRARTNVGFFRQLIALLQQRHVWSEPIYRYALQHNELGALREWLRHRDDFLAQLGPWLDSKPIQIDPIERRAYEHLEYSPLVNQRAHRLGAEHRIANEILLTQYQRLLHILAHKPALDPVDSISVTYYLFLQDRVEEGLARLQTIAPEALPTRLQYDYFRCYAALYEEKLPEARGLAATYANYPVDRWRTLFAEVTAQLNEIEGRDATRQEDKDREKQQAALANTQPAFDFKIENRAMSLTWKKLSEVTVNYYLMDPEFLFSSSPFVSADPGRFSIIKATRTVKLPLPGDKDAMDVPLPVEFAKANVLIEMLGAGQRKAQPYHANSLKLTIAEQYGRLEARDIGSDKAVSKAYVKVYARLKNGTIRFLKDGYTDLRGKFDYLSLNSRDPSIPVPPPVPVDTNRQAPGGNLDYQLLLPNELDQVGRLSILIMSDAHGAATREVAPPRE